MLADTIPGIRVVKAFAQEKREVERFVQANDRVLDANDRVNVVWSFFGPMVRLLTDLGLLVVWVFGAGKSSARAITVGQLTAFVAYITRFYTQIESMIRMVSASQRAAAASHRIFEILDRRPSVAEPVKPVPLGRVRGRIELADVKFRYGSCDVLHGVDLEIRPGEMIGLVGPSGAGKSTLINLVCRFYDVAEGAILVDGVRRPLVSGRRLSPQHRHRPAGAVFVLRHDRGEHCLRQSGRDAPGDRRRRPRRSGARVHSSAARRLRFARRRTRPIPIRRRAAADFNRSGRCSSTRGY